MPARILIVEDEAKMRRLLELNLGEDGFKTVSAADAEMGVKLLASESVDLVLTDLKLPGMSGLDALKAIRERVPSTRAVILTLHYSTELLKEIRRMGGKRDARS